MTKGKVVSGERYVSIDEPRMDANKRECCACGNRIPLRPSASLLPLHLTLHFRGSFELRA
jgi:hypothetical protein